MSVSEWSVDGLQEVASPEEQAQAMEWMIEAEKLAGTEVTPTVMDLLLFASECYIRGVEEAFLGVGEKWGLDAYTGGDLGSWAVSRAVGLLVVPQAPRPCAGCTGK